MSKEIYVNAIIYERDLCDPKKAEKVQNINCSLKELRKQMAEISGYKDVEEAPIQTTKGPKSATVLTLHGFSKGGDTYYEAHYTILKNPCIHIPAVRLEFQQLLLKAYFQSIWAIEQTELEDLTEQDKQMLASFDTIKELHGISDSTIDEETLEVTLHYDPNWSN